MSLPNPLVVLGAPSMSIYRDFMVPRVCQFTEILPAKSNGRDGQEKSDK